MIPNYLFFLKQLMLNYIWRNLFIQFENLARTVSKLYTTSKNEIQQKKKKNTIELAGKRPLVSFHLHVTYSARFVSFQPLWMIQWKCVLTLCWWSPASSCWKSQPSYGKAMVFTRSANLQVDPYIVIIFKGDARVWQVIDGLWHFLPKCISVVWVVS